MNKNNTSDGATALLFDQHSPIADEVQELLSSYGISVYRNSPNDENSAYCIVVGVPEFVKTITDSRIYSQSKCIAIITMPTGMPDPRIPEAPFKNVLVNTPNLTDQELKQIFRFLITSSQSILDLRTADTYPKIAEKNVVRLMSTEQVHDGVPDLDVSLARINTVIRDIYGSEDKKGKRAIRNKISYITRPVIFLAGLCCAVCIWYYVSFALSVTCSYISYSQAMGHSMANARISNRISLFFISQTRFILFVSQFPLRAIGLQKAVRNQEQFIQLAEDTSQLISDGFTIYGISKNLVTNLFNGIQGNSTSKTFATEISSLKIMIPDIRLKTDLINAELTFLIHSRRFPFTITPVADYAKKILRTLENLSSSLTLFDKAITVYTQSGGFDKNKIYLVLLQNSAELRPTGGFIGSYAIISMQNGIITSMNFQDVYTADGQLKGHVDPPLPIRTILGSEHWYLRDSNWNPDFSESAQSAAWFYKNEMNTDVDGVIGITSRIFVDILRLTGPILISEYNDTISADNFYAKSLYYTEHDFFPGSTQKKDFISVLSHTLLTTLKKTSLDPGQVMDIMSSGIEGHEIQMYFTGANLQERISRYGWSGENPTRTHCQQIQSDSACVTDYIRMTEANLSVSKINAMISRSVYLNIDLLTSGKQSSVLTVKYKNNSSVNTPKMSGPYRNYMRFMVPNGIRLTQIMLDGTPVRIINYPEMSADKIPFATIENLSDNQSATMAVAFDVPPGKETTLSLSYETNSGMLSGHTPFTYNLLLTKQPGISQTPLYIQVQYPTDWTARHQGDGPEPMVANAGELEYNTVQIKDTDVQIYFEKNN